MKVGQKYYGDKQLNLAPNYVNNLFFFLTCQHYAVLKQFILNWQRVNLGKF